MKISELRIGNYIHFSNASVIIEVDFSHFKEFFFYKKAKKLYFPIRLTGKWLFKLGCKKIGYKYYIGEYIIRLYEDQHLIEFCIEMVDDADYVLSECRYVHELQNIYYELTKDELVIKSIIEQFVQK